MTDPEPDRRPPLVSPEALQELLKKRRPVIVELRCGRDHVSPGRSRLVGRVVETPPGAVLILHGAVPPRREWLHPPDWLGDIRDYAIGEWTWAEPHAWVQPWCPEHRNLSLVDIAALNRAVAKARKTETKAAVLIIQ